jgi:hypothetical protein
MGESLTATPRDLTLEEISRQADEWLAYWAEYKKKPTPQEISNSNPCRGNLLVAASALAVMLVMPGTGRVSQQTIIDNTPPVPRIVDNDRPPVTTEIGGTVIPKGSFKPNAIVRVAQSVVMVYNADGQCSASVIGQKKLSSAAHCEIALGDTVYVPSTGQFTTVVGVAPAAEGDVVIVQTDQKLDVSPLKIAAPEYRVTIGPLNFKTSWHAPFSEKLKTTEDVAIIGFPGLKIFQRAAEGQEILNTNMKRHAFPAHADNKRLSRDSTAATGSVPDKLPPYSAPDPETLIRGMSGGPAVNQQGEIVGLASEGSTTHTTRMLGRSLVYIQTVDKSTQFCVSKEGQETTTVTLEHLLTMNFTGNNRCS